MPGSQSSGSPSDSSGDGTQAGTPGQPGFDPRAGASGSNDGNSGTQRDGSTGDLGSGSQGSLGTQPSGGGGDYTLDTLPDGTFGGAGTQQTAGVVSSANRAKVLDEQLRRGYEVFDGLILEERGRTQTEVDRNSGGGGGVDVASSSGAGGDLGGVGAANQPQTISGPGAETGVPVGTVASSTPPPPGQTYAPPEDIPSGRDDDVVARQLREAAMREPDPELREALWDEYRKYTGISEQ